MGLKPLKFMPWIAVLGLAVSCAKSSRHEGGQDGGGGHALVSSESDVDQALAQALDLAREPNYQLNMFYAYLADAVENAPNDPRTALAFRVFSGKSLRDLPDREAPDWLKTHFVDLLNASTVHYAKDADCGPAQFNHADASVSAFKRGADLCFSPRNLRKLPPPSLLREISSLILHEVTHLAGFGETEAQTLQAAFSEYFAYRFGNTSKRWLVEMTSTSLQDIHSVLDNVNLSLLYPIPASLQPIPVYIALQVRAEMTVLRPTFDPLVLKILFPDRSWKDIFAYLYSAAMLNADADRHYTLSEIPGWAGPANPNQEAYDSALSAFAVFSHDWQYLAEGKGGVVCLKQQMQLRLEKNPDEGLRALPILDSLVTPKIMASKAFGERFVSPFDECD